MKVLKFGGTSMGSATSIKKVATVIQNKIDNKVKIIVVCSAMSGITNSLFKIGNLAEKSLINSVTKLFKKIKQHHFDVAEKLEILDNFEKESESIFEDLYNFINNIILIRELSESSIAYLSSFGERLSTRLLTLFLKTKSLNVKQFDSIFIKTQGNNFLEDDIDWSATKKHVQNTLTKVIDDDIIPIITGFYGTNNQGVITLLGRGGSDFSGAILSVSLEIPTLEIWTDVDGFLSADPRIVKDAISIDELGYQEASELCFFGAKVLHPKSIRPVIDNFGEVWIKNTFSPKKLGTKIIQRAKESKHAVLSISSKKVIMISLDLFAIHKSKQVIFSELFSLTEKYEIFIDMIAASEAEISFCIEEKYLSNNYFFDSLQEICPLYSKNDRSIVCIVSPKDVKGQVGIAGKIFGAISDSNVSIDMYSQNASEIAQLIVVKSIEVPNVIKNLHKTLVLNGEKKQ